MTGHASKHVTIRLLLPSCPRRLFCLSLNIMSVSYISHASLEYMRRFSLSYSLLCISCVCIGHLGVENDARGHVGGLEIDPDACHFEGKRHEA